MIVRYTIVRKCLFTQWTSSLSLDEDVLYIETQSLLFHCRHAQYIDECTMVTEWSDSSWWKWVMVMPLINFWCPYGLDIDDDNQSIVIADFGNHRIVEWKMGAINGKVVAGGQGQENRLDQLYHPTDVLIDKETNSLFIADRANQRVRSMVTTSRDDAW